MPYRLRSTQRSFAVYTRRPAHLGHALQPSSTIAGGIVAGRIRQWLLYGVVAGTHVCWRKGLTPTARTAKKLTGLGLGVGIFFEFRTYGPPNLVYANRCHQFLHGV